MDNPRLSPKPTFPKSQTKPLFGVILADLRSRENVGSIFRTADAAGVSKIYLCGITPRPPHVKISKTALGAEESVAWEYRTQTRRLLDQLKKEGHEILILEQTPKSENIFLFAEDYFKSRSSKRLKSDKKLVTKSSIGKKTTPGLQRGIVLVLGNEVNGISKKLLNYATHTLYIPMYGTKESLNVAVAFGIAIYALKAK